MFICLLTPLTVRAKRLWLLSNNNTESVCVCVRMRAYIAEHVCLELRGLFTVLRATLTLTNMCTESQFSSDWLSSPRAFLGPAPNGPRPSKRPICAKLGYWFKLRRNASQKVAKLFPCTISSSCPPLIFHLLEKIWYDNLFVNIADAI